MSNTLTRACRPLAMPSADKAVLMALADMAREPDDPDHPAMTWLPMTGEDGAVGLVDWTCISERGVQRAIKRLVAGGYITRRQKRHGVIYTVHPPDAPALTPVTLSGDTMTPDKVSPDTVTVTPVTMTPKASTSIKPKKATPSQDAREAKPLAIVVPDWIPADAWNGWLAMRKAKRAPPTPRAIELAIMQLRKLADEGHPPGAVLDQSTLKNWTDLYPIKENRNERHDAGPAGAGGDYRPGPVTRAIAAAYDAVDASKW